VPSRESAERFLAFGHLNVLATHPSTLMFTRETELSKQGDCIIAVAADKAVLDLSREFKDRLRLPNAKLTITIEVDNLTEQINASGSPNLILTHPTDMVIRKSNYICTRTLAIHADKSANDLARELIEKLKNPNQKATITLTITN
jgi:uncharacterized protein